MNLHMGRRLKRAMGADESCPPATYEIDYGKFKNNSKMKTLSRLSLVSLVLLTVFSCGKESKESVAEFHSINSFSPLSQ